MPYAKTDDGVRLYFEETGSGHPVILVHEFAGDYRSWEPQMRHFGQRYRAITYNARGYPPSDVPEQVSAYSQARAADDILVGAGSSRRPKAHIVGLSMGGFATLHFGLRHPAARAVAVCRWLRLRRRTRQAGDVSRRSRGDRRHDPSRGHGGLRREIRLRPDARAVREQGPARLRRVQDACWPSTRRWDRRNTQQGVQRSGLRSTTWSSR